MTIAETKLAVEVMQHYCNGGKVELWNPYIEEWQYCNSPLWDWEDFDYRILKED